MKIGGLNIPLTHYIRTTFPTTIEKQMCVNV